MNVPLQPIAASLELLDYHQRLDDFIAARLHRLRDLPFAKIERAGQHIRFLPPGKTLVSMGLAPFDAALAADNFKNIVEILLAGSQGNELAKAVQHGIDAGDFAEKHWSEDLAVLEKRFNCWAKNANIDGDSLVQLAHWALSPFWRLAAEMYADDLKELVSNERRTCPICGKHPDFALLNEQEHGRRYLVCLSCNWQWAYKRLGCTYCNNSDHSQLGYLLIENTPGYRIYLCEKCRSYLKTFDQREDTVRLDNNPLLESVKTLFMDLLAIEKGYLPMHGQEC